MRKNEEKFYIGMSFGFNASACLISNQRGVLAAISQERLNGKKNTKEIPIDAVVECCKMSGVKVVEKVAYSHYQRLSVKEVYNYVSDERRAFLNNSMLDSNKTDTENAEMIIIDLLKREGIEVKSDEIVRINHHTAHQYSAFGVYGKYNMNHVSITSDGFGDGISGRITVCKDGQETILSEAKTRNSVALVYQFVTGALGYKMHQHEGKITGLAAFGQPKYVDDFMGLFKYTDGCNLLEYDEQGQDIHLTYEDCELIKQNEAIDDFEGFLKLKYSVFRLIDDLKEKGATDEDIASSVQEFAEKVTLNWIDEKLVPWLEYNNLKGKISCYLAGGLFANVKLNQRIKDTGIFSKVLVSPAMGDEGTCVGAAIKAAKLDGKYDNLSFIHDFDEVSEIFVGTDIFRNISSIVNTLKEKGFKIKQYQYFNQMEQIEDIANYLAEKKLVCLCRGKMEFGPRALCHRSILYDCSDKSVNEWLNKQLGRTEFMPFAPVCLKRYANDLFENIQGAELSCKFMTMTLDCKQEFIDNYPAACHIDNTARPQFVTHKSDGFMASILDKYKEKTGKKVLINTSFNLHNNPIIEDPITAIESWEKSNTDVLVIGSLVIIKK